MVPHFFFNILVALSLTPMSLEAEADAAHFLAAGADFELKLDEVLKLHEKKDALGKYS